MREYYYSPFGAADSIRIQQGDKPPRFEYNLKEKDFEIYYYGARWYDPDIGRFLGVDPIMDYYNPYSYCRNNPIRYIDPSGMAVDQKIGSFHLPTPPGGWGMVKGGIDLPRCPFITQEYFQARMATTIALEAPLMAEQKAMEDYIKSLCFGKNKSGDQGANATGSNEAKGQQAANQNGSRDFIGPFKSEEAAAADFSVKYNDDSIKTNREYITNIYRVWWCFSKQCMRGTLLFI